MVVQPNYKDIGIGPVDSYASVSMLGEIHYIWDAMNTQKWDGFDIRNYNQIPRGHVV